MRLAILIVIMALCFCWPAESTTYVVAPDGSGDFPTIQSAIEAAVDGDVIELLSGTFTGEGNRDIDFLGKAITVRSQHGIGNPAIIGCSYLGRGVLFQHEEGHDSILEGVVISGGYDQRGAGICCMVSSPTIRQCVLSDGHATERGGGIYAEESAAEIEECVFANNYAQNFGGGLCGWDSDVCAVDCTFIGNSAHQEGGGACFDGLLYGSMGSIVRGCTFYGNSAEGAGSGIADREGRSQIQNTIVAFGVLSEGVSGGPSFITLTCCDVYGNEGGDWVGGIEDQYGVTGNISEDPLFCDPESEDFHLQEDSPCAPFSPPNEECDLIGAWPVGCEVTPVQSASWGAIKAMFR